MLFNSAINHCVSCGQRIVFEEGSMFNNHKCSKAHEAGKLAASRDYDYSRTRTFTEKLKDAEIMRHMVEA